MPESRHKYLYERLGDHDFQQLVGALLVEQYGDFVPMALRQADGGRDGVRRSTSSIYQVKWSVGGSEKDPVNWLDATVRAEATNLTRLASEGTKRYVLVTNVPSTAARNGGTFDRVNANFEAYSKQYGLEVTALWREALDAMVDSAPTEIKWAYAEMLAGWDLVRYLVAEQLGAAGDSSTRNLVRRVAAYQWDRDRHVKFSEVELDRSQIAALFVDVEADRVHRPLFGGTNISSLGSVGGAAGYLVSEKAFPFSLVRGAPGQGKSTLGQLVCQAHRAAFVPGADGAGDLPVVERPRFPLRVDLGSYAAWRSGEDVFDESGAPAPKKLRKRRTTEATVEDFLAATLAHAGASPGLSADDVHELFARVPSLVVLDGLDEVGSVKDRKQVVAEIDGFCSRARTHAEEGVRVVVTTRPNSSNLAEPDAGVFEAIVLTPLDKELRGDYLRKWCAVNQIDGREGRKLRANFDQKTQEPHIGELASNPMQLTILLHLLRQFGDATPDQRTPLYDKYMEALLSREANKHPASVRNHQGELREMVPFLGWYLQSRTEEWAHSGRMTKADVVAAMKQFQSAYDRPLAVVDELFEATTDRLWALTSKVQGTFEFEVLSLREYFAARYLYEAAGEEDRHFDRSVVLRELLRRPFWLNTARFYGGNATGSDLHSLQAGIEDELDEGPTRQFIVAAWSLICDGVFDRRPKAARDLVTAIVKADHDGYLVPALDSREITSLPDQDHATGAFDQLAARIAFDPADPGNAIRVRIIQDVLDMAGDFTDWWLGQMRAAVGTVREEAWLTIGAICEVLAGKRVEIAGLVADHGRKAQLILNTGLVPEPNSLLRHQLVQAVLGGQCSETTSARWEAGWLAVDLDPAELIPELWPRDNGYDSDYITTTRSRATRQLRELHKYPSPAKVLNPTNRSKGTTLSYAELSADLTAVVGRCWLAIEIAVIGASTPLRNGFQRQREDQPFGPTGTAGALIEETRQHRTDVQWWRDRRVECKDELSSAEWAFALWAVADGEVLDQLLGELELLVQELSEDRYRALLLASGRLAQAGYLTDRRVSAAPTSVQGAELLGARGLRPTSGAPAVQQAIAGAPEEALAAVARKSGWLKVDRIAVYR